VTDASNPERGLLPETVQEKRFGMARKLGADFCFDVGIPAQREALAQKVQEETDGTGVDVAFEMSGSYHAYEDAFKIIRMGGTISLLGIPEGKMSLDFANTVVFKGVTLHGIIGRRVFSTWETMKALLKAGLSDLLMEHRFVSHDLPLTEFEEGFRAMMSVEAFKVVFRPV